VLNEQTGKVVRAITNNRYQSVRVDAALNVLVESLEDQRQVPLHQLSGGTVDQIYFGLEDGHCRSGQWSNKPTHDSGWIRLFSTAKVDWTRILMMLGESGQRAPNYSLYLSFTGRRSADIQKDQSSPDRSEMKEGANAPS